jgi:hypothetical protein
MSSDAKERCVAPWPRYLIVERVQGAAIAVDGAASWSMIPKSGNRFSAKIMLKQ